MCEICEWALEEWTPEDGLDDKDVEWIEEYNLDRSIVIRHHIPVE